MPWFALSAYSQLIVQVKAEELEAWLTVTRYKPEGVAKWLRQMKIWRPPIKQGGLHGLMSQPTTARRVTRVEELPTRRKEREARERAEAEGQPHED